MARTGRPRVEIDKRIFEELCSILCTEEEIAGVFNCSIDTINRFCKREYKETFADTIKRLSANGKSSLRRAQYKLALSGNATMQIWLGRNWLGQIDRATDNVDTEDTDDYFGEAGI